MASDLPDSTAYESSLAMARVLVTYIDCPHRIRREIRGEFYRAPTISTINRLRRQHLESREKRPEQHFKVHEGYYPTEVSRSAEQASKEFLRRLHGAYPERFAA